MMKTRCLIVEDAAFLREVYRFSLKNEEIEIVDEAVDGMEAMIKINQLKPDLVLLDLVLPLKNGIDILKEVGRISPNTKCIVISSIDDQDVIDKALALGALKYLTKPFTKAQLLDAVHMVTKSFGEVQNG
jgi:two-component system chemotaxis response regulator CheY